MGRTRRQTAADTVPNGGPQSSLPPAPLIPPDPPPNPVSSPDGSFERKDTEPVETPDEEIPLPDNLYSFTSAPLRRRFTPTKMEAGDVVWMSTHTRDAVSPYIEHDLKEAAKVPLESYSRAIFGLEPERLRSWAEELRDMNIFQDAEIQNSLTEYSSAEKETSRYAPFIDICHRIIHRTRGKLTGLGKKYPVDNFRFLNNANRVVERIEEHRGLGAERKPDILGVCRSTAQRAAKGGSVQWTDILVVVELKKRKHLLEKLEKERARRASSSTHQKHNSNGTRRSKKSLKMRKTQEGRDQRPVEDDQLAGIYDLRNPWARDKETTISESRVGVATQTASYALEGLACTYGTRLYCLAMIVDDDSISLWYYDATGIVYTSQYVSLIEHFELFAAIIVGLASLRHEQFGMLPESIFVPPTPLQKRFPPKRLAKYTISVPHPQTTDLLALTLEKSTFTAYSLVGRRTFLYSLHDEPRLSSDKLISKFSYQVSSRKKEEDLVELAKRNGVGHMPSIHLTADLLQLSDGVREAFHDYDNKRIEYENRTLRIIVYSAYYPIQDLFKKRIDLIPVMAAQILDCLHDLFYKAHILHRDVSVNNIMWELRGNEAAFKLIDFDMAVVVPNEAKGTYIASSKHRTGTLPFMASELIFDAHKATQNNSDDWNPLQHRLRHDFESLYLVCMWCLITLFRDDMTEEEAYAVLAFVRSWETGSNLLNISLMKGRICSLGISTLPASPPVAILPLIPWLEAWTDILRVGDCVLARHHGFLHVAELTGKKPEAFDLDTAGGVITRDAIKAALTPLMPCDSAELTEDTIKETTSVSSSSLLKSNASSVVRPSSHKPLARQTRQRTRALAQVDDETEGRETNTRPRAPLAAGKCRTRKILPTIPEDEEPVRAPSRALAPTRPRRTRKGIEPVQTPKDLQAGSRNATSGPRKVSRKRVREEEGDSEKIPTVDVQSRAPKSAKKTEDDRHVVVDTGVRSRLRPRRPGVVYKC